MMQTKVTTWKELEKSIGKLPTEMQRKVLPNIRNTIYRNMAKLETLAEFAAYQAAPRTKAAVKTGRLRRTIERFKNTRNTDKAYVVLGLKTMLGRFVPAYYAGMQLGGYAPGRYRTSQKAAYVSGTTKAGGYSFKKFQEVKETGISKRIQFGRDLLRKERRSIKKVTGKNYISKAEKQAGLQVEQAAFKEAVSQFEKMLDRM